MSVVRNPENRFWRTDERLGSRNIYVLLSNDVAKPSKDDPLIGVMETSVLTEKVVTTHNTILQKFGRRGIQ